MRSKTNTKATRPPITLLIWWCITSATKTRGRHTLSIGYRREMQRNGANATSKPPARPRDASECAQRGKLQADLQDRPEHLLAHIAKDYLSREGWAFGSVVWSVSLCDSGAPSHISCQREDADEGPQRAPSLLLADVIGGGSIGQSMRRSEVTVRTQCSSLSKSISYHFVYWLFGGLTLLLLIRKSERWERGMKL